MNKANTRGGSRAGLSTPFLYCYLHPLLISSNTLQRFARTKGKRVNFEGKLGVIFLGEGDYKSFV